MRIAAMPMGEPQLYWSRKASFAAAVHRTKREVVARPRRAFSTRQIADFSAADANICW